jgi:hypothetical protein
MKKSKIVIAILTLVVFVGVDFYDSGRRASSIQHRAFAYSEMCQDRLDPINRSNDQCFADFRRANDGALRKGMMDALPTAAGAAAVFLALALLFMRLRSRKRDEAVAD